MKKNKKWITLAALLLVLAAAGIWNSFLRQSDGEKKWSLIYISKEKPHIISPFSYPFIIRINYSHYTTHPDSPQQKKQPALQRLC